MGTATRVLSVLAMLAASGCVAGGESDAGVDVPDFAEDEGAGTDDLGWVSPNRGLDPDCTDVVEIAGEARRITIGCTPYTHDEGRPWAPESAWDQRDRGDPIREPVRSRADHFDVQADDSVAQTPSASEPH